MRRAAADFHKRMAWKLYKKWSVAGPHGGRYVLLEDASFYFDLDIVGQPPAGLIQHMRSDITHAEFKVVEADGRAVVWVKTWHETGPVMYARYGVGGGYWCTVADYEYDQAIKEVELDAEARGIEHKLEGAP